MQHRVIFRRICSAAVLLCIVFSCAVSLGEGAYEFDVSAVLNPETETSENSKTVNMAKEMLEAFSISGTINAGENGFDASLSLDDKSTKESLTTLHAYGTDAKVVVASPLLGDQKIVLDMAEWFEFAMKAYFHLNIPLQRVAFLTSTYAHTSVWEPVISEISGTIDNALTETDNGKMKISNKDMLALCQSVSNRLCEDKGFEYWVKALALETGFDDYFMETVSLLPDWFKDVSEGKDVIIEKNENGEQWSCNGNVIFVRESGVWSISLPALLDGSTFVASGDTSEDDSTHSFTISCRLKNGEGVEVLNLYLKAANFPKTFDGSMNCTLVCSAEGALLPSSVKLSAETTVSEGNLLISLKSGDDMTPTATISGKLNLIPQDSVPDYTGTNLNTEGAIHLFAINDAVLKELIDNVMEPMISGALPILARIPASFFQQVMSFMDSSGLLESITEGGLSGMGD